MGTWANTKGGIPLSPPEERWASPSMFSVGRSSVSGIMPCHRSTMGGIRSVKALTRISGVISFTIQ